MQLARLTSHASASTTSRMVAPAVPMPAIRTRAARRSIIRAAIEAQKGTGLTYKQAGVDIDAGDELVRRIQKMNPSIGGFSGMVPFGDSFLVAGTDGVGTKLKLAFELNKHDTVGIDLVAMSVNDVVCSGAAPMFFLDYYATGRLDVDAAEQVIKGIVEGCRQSGCQLLGGETAEMPGFYQSGEYDLAGFAVGAVKKNKLIEGKKNIIVGDVVLGLASSGIHSNGFSLVRKVLEVSGTSLDTPVPWGATGANGHVKSFGDALIEPTIIYVKQVLDLHDKVGLKGLVHITGGGMPENIPRVIPDGLGVEVTANSYEVPPMFQWLQATGNVPIDDLRRTFNMGVGMVVIVAAENVAAIQKLAPEAWVLGKVVQGDGVRFV